MGVYQEFPRCLYKGPDVSLIVRDEAAKEAALKEGWSLTVNIDNGPAKVMADIADFHKAHEASWINDEAPAEAPVPAKRGRPKKAE